MAQLVVTVDDLSALPNLRTAIRQLKGVAKVTTLRHSKAKVGVGKYRAGMEERLTELSLLKEGWDGQDSKAIEKTCIDGFRNALEIIPDMLLKNWVLFPDAHGYLYLDYVSGKDIAGLTLMPTKLVGFVKKNGVLEKSDSMEFSTANILSILKRVHG